MSQTVEAGTKTFTAGAAIGKYIRVKLSSGVLAVAVAADLDLGTLQDESFASGDKRTVRLRNSPGTTKMVADAAISAAANVFSRAAGKVGATATGSYFVGIALEAATADGDIIEVLRLDSTLAEL